MRKRVFDNRSRQEVGARDVSTDVLILVVLVLDSNVKKELPSISLLYLHSLGTTSHRSVVRRPPYRPTIMHSSNLSEKTGYELYLCDEG